MIARRQNVGRIVPLCLESAVGFPTPRPPSDIQGTGTAPKHAFVGADVLTGDALIIEDTGTDVSTVCAQAADCAVDCARRHNCRHAVLTDGSTSFRSTFIHVGPFSGTTKPGVGATMAAARNANISVWSETAIAGPDALLRW